MYSVRILRRAVRDIAVLPEEYARLVSQHIGRLAQEPRPPDVKKLRAREDYSLRVGVYRILFEIDDAAHLVTIFRVKHRREAYR